MTVKKKKRSTGWDDVPVQDSGTAFYECYDSFTLTDEYEQVRLLGEVVTIIVGWIPALKKGGKGDTAYPVMSLANDGKDCPLIKAGVSIQKLTLTNSIIRSIQENKPNKKIKIPKQKYRKKGDKFWSPIRVIKFPNGPANKVKNLKSLNKVRTKSGFKTFPVNHEKYGIDILVSFDSSQSGGAMYEIQKDERTPLSKEERRYLLYNLESVFDTIPEEDDIIEKLREAYNKNLFNKDNCNLRELKKVIAYGEDEDFDEDDSEDNFSMKSKKKKKSVKSKKKSKKQKRRKNDVEDDFEDGDDFEDEDNDDFDEDFEEEDDFDDIDSDEDSDDEDDFDGEDFDDEDDFDDDDSEDDFDDDDEEDYEPKRKKKKKVNKKKKSKEEKRKRARSRRNRYED